MWAPHHVTPPFGEQRSASGWAFPGVSYRHPTAPSSPRLPSLLIWLGHCLPVPVIAFACCCVFKNSLGPRSPPLLISQLPRGALGITSRHDNPTHIVDSFCTLWLFIFCPGWIIFLNCFYTFVYVYMCMCTYMYINVGCKSQHWKYRIPIQFSKAKFYLTLKVFKLAYYNSKGKKMIMYIIML